MIFLTVGTQLPFDRLVSAVDGIAESNKEPIVAQIGQTSNKPKWLDWHVSLAPHEFERYIASARLVIAHAGTGTVIAAQRHHKPIILFPRLSSLGEHRNDHQMATCKQLEATTGIYVAYEPDDIARIAVRTDLIPATEDLGSLERRSLVDNLRSYLATNR